MDNGISRNKNEEYTIDEFDVDCVPDKRINDSSSGTVALKTEGRSLKVHTGDTPHLVSLGGDRFSTDVTLHRIPADGSISFGCGSNVDVAVFGTGVEELHCWIQNKEGVVTLYPNSDNILIDGLKITQPTRLTQGCMLCLGRSNFLRFNHPEEAKYMKSVLPNTRVSIMPNVFYPTSSDDLSESKISSDSRRSYDSPDSWCDMSSGTSSDDLLSCRNEQILKHISPKVFPPGSSTLNSPASVVLGYKYSNQLSLAGNNRKNEITDININGNCVQKPVSSTNDGNNNNISNDENNKYNNVDRVGGNNSTEVNGIQKQRITIPSPAFDRNPSYNDTKYGSPVNGDASPITAFSFSSPRLTNGNHISSKGHSTPENNWHLSSPSSPITNTDFNGYTSDGSVKKVEFGNRRNQAHNNRILEQEKERLERLRLEEILTLCAEYEKQAQYDRKSQIRIMTNGSLPREKKHSSSSVPSPGIKSADSPKNGLVVFSFDNRKEATKNNLNSEINDANGRENVFYPSSPRPRIKTVASPKDVFREHHALEILENKLAILNDHEILNVSKNSKRANVKERRNNSTYNPNLETCRSKGTVYEKIKLYNSNCATTLPPVRNGCIPNCRSETQKSNSDTLNKITSVKETNIKNKYKFFGLDPKEFKNQEELQSLPCKSDIMSQSYHESYNSSLDSQNLDMFTSLIEFNDRNKNEDTNRYNSNSSKCSTINSYTRVPSRYKDKFGSNKSVNNIEINKESNSKTKNSEMEKLNGLVLELNEIVKDTQMSLSSNNDSEQKKKTHESKFIFPLDEIPCNNSDNDNRFILPLEEINTALRRQCFTLKKSELKKLQAEQTFLLEAINDVKKKLAEIQQQKDEIMKELEMEKALIEAELKSENLKLVKEEDVLLFYQTEIQQCESEIEVCSKNQIEREAQNTEIVTKQQDNINRLEEILRNANENKDESEKSKIQKVIRKERDILEDESKKFEDFEFRLLEEEASLLSKREELQIEINKVQNCAEDIRTKVSDLFTQKEILLQNASDEIKQLELQVRSHTYTLQQNHTRLQEIGLKLKDTSRSLSEISECTSDSFDDTILFNKTQSQEDLDRISRVTSDAPIVETGSSNSLGRRTIASLQEIERNRQLHLAQQGSHVIEEERKRVLALKRRVQDEVKAEWEEKKQRENSMNSDDSSFASIDHIDGSSPNSEEYRRTSDDSTLENSVANESNSSTIHEPGSKREEDDKIRKTRHPSNASMLLQQAESSSVVKIRHTKSSSSVPRPESRHSLYKHESFDLRHHIESAGHLLHRCPQVIVDKTSCRGYLQKMTTKFRTWNKRWFVFDRARCSFVYYSDKTEKKAKGGTYFQGLIDLYIDKANLVKSPNPHATFIVKSKERTFYLMASNIEVMRIWFDVLATEVDVYHDN